jgi:hypothetical protein
VLSLDQGVNNAVMSWGDILLAKYVKMKRVVCDGGVGWDYAVIPYLFTWKCMVYEMHGVCEVCEA